MQIAGADWNDLVREFRARPIGPHSSALARLLSHLRAGEIEGKYCLICTEPHRSWVIGSLSGQRGVPPSVFDNRVFDSVEKAEWAIFKLRCREAGLPPIDETLP
jgi:hypothetical protein